MRTLPTWETLRYHQHIMLPPTLKPRPRGPGIHQPLIILICSPPGSTCTTHPQCLRWTSFSCPRTLNSTRACSSRRSQTYHQSYHLLRALEIYPLHPPLPLSLLQMIIRQWFKATLWNSQTSPARSRRFKSPYHHCSPESHLLSKE